MAVVVFEDQQCELLAPITLTRPTATITCGSFKLVDFLDLLFDEVFSIVRPHLSSLQRSRYPTLRSLGNDAGMEIVSDRPVALLLNSRIAPTADNLQALQKLIEMLEDAGADQTCVVMDGEHVAAVLNPQWSLHHLFGLGYLGMDDWIEKAKALPQLAVSLKTFSYAHDVILINHESFRSNLDLRKELIATGLDLYGDYQEIAPEVFTAPGVTVGPHVTFDTSIGPIFIDRGTVIGACAYLKGPVFLGSKCQVVEQSSIKNGVSIGDECKVGGEVQASVLESFTNKQHHGYVGWSYVGSCVNLAAGTSVSENKSNLGVVNIEYSDGKRSTGSQLLGCVVGDFSISAVNTGILSGKLIGACSMVYGFVTSNVPSFTHYAHTFGQCSSISPEQMTSICERVSQLRNIQQRNGDAQLIRDLYHLTQIERDCAGIEQAV